MISLDIGLLTCTVCLLVAIEVCRRSLQKLYTSYVGSDDEKKVDDDMEGELVCEPPPKEECPICMQPMPYYNSAECGIGNTYMPCCGKYVNVVDVLLRQLMR